MSLGETSLASFELADAPVDKHGFRKIPVLLALVPPTVAAGSGDTLLIAVGDGFYNPTQLIFDGHTLDTTWFSNMGVFLPIPSTYLVDPGYKRVRVHNVNGYSNYLTFTVTASPQNLTMALDKATLSISAKDLVLAPVNYVLALAPTTLSISTKDMPLQAGYGLPLNKATITITAQNINTDAATHVMQLDKATLSITAQNMPTLTDTRTMALDKATVTITAKNLVLAPTHYIISFNRATIAITAQPLGIDVGPTFNLPLPQYITGPAPLPGPIADYTAPFSPVAVPPAAPKWSDGNFRIAQPGDVIVYFGDGITSDTTFTACGGDNVLNGCTLLSVDYAAQRVCVLLSPSLPPNEMYVLWMMNSQGVGEPLVINRPETRWLAADTTGFNQAAVGDTVRIQGINLTASGASWVYLVPVAGGVGQYVDPDGGNVANDKYQVKFQVPNVTAGDYYVYLHNGAGGQYGWSLCPQTLTVQPAFQYYSASFPTDIDAGDPTGGDDKPSLQALITSIGNNGPATIALRAATYQLDSQLSLIVGGNKGVRLKGQGHIDTIIQVTGNGINNGVLHGDSVAQIEGLTLDCTGVTLGTGNASGAFVPRVVNCTINTKGASGPAWLFSGGGAQWNAYANGSTFIGPNNFGSNPLSTCVLFCAFRLTDGGAQSAALHLAGGTNVLVQNSTCEDYTPGGTNPDELGFGKFVYVSFDSDNVYVANNITTDLFSSGNTGEQINSADGTQTAFTGTATSSITVGGVEVITTSSPHGTGWLAITAGKGIGQWARVVSTTGTTMTLDRPLRVHLDGTSQYIIGFGVATRWVVFSNNLAGNADASTSSTGYETFGNGADIVVDSNLCADMVFGLVDDGTTFNTLFQDNHAAHCQNGLRSFAEDYGFIARRHNGTACVQREMWIESPKTGFVLDSCTFADAPLGVHSRFGSGGNTIIGLWNTTFDRGTGTFSGSVANDDTSHVVEKWGTSAFLNFQVTF